jgi:pseudaminic acid synthase
MKNINIKSRIFSENSPVYIIAEMSANHGGNIEYAKEIFREAKNAGADCIKIQTYKPETMTIDSNNDAFMIKEGSWKGQTLFKLYESAFTPWEWQKELFDYATEIGIDFLSTPFDVTAVDLLEELGVSFYKVASFELTDIPLLKYVGSKGKPILLSTGMASIDEIQEALDTIESTGNNQIILLKCNSSYPAKYDEMNIRTIYDMKDRFNKIIGLSDHTLGTATSIAAVAMGAKIIEKHFCLSRKIHTADSFFSMEPEEFKNMVENIRIVEKSLGTVQYGITNSEKNSLIFRRSIFITKDMKKGEIFTNENIRVIRPSSGLEPKFYEEVIGKKASLDLKKGTPLLKDYIL